jgi:CheY-like chemotaxis protein
VSTVDSGGAALDLLGAGGVSMLVSDLAMPIMDGGELVRRVRNIPELAGIPAIALSAHVRPDEATAALAAGFDLHIGKPVDIAQLITAIDALARIKSSPAAARTT